MGTGERCSEGYKLNCSHSIEAILMLLSHSPQRLSIKEIASFTRFHRNTVRPALKDHMDEKDPNEGYIKYMGEGNYRVYYYESVSDHYRRIARTIHELEIPGLSEDLKSKILRQTGYNFVKKKLDRIMAIVEDETIGKKFEHKSPVEALVHIKMGYPFNDLKYESLDGTDRRTEVKPSISFSVKGDNWSEIDPKDFDLKICPCLCEGKPEQSFACEFVAGTLEGTIKGALKVDSRVTKITDVDNELIEEKTSEEKPEKPGCTFNIKTDIQTLDQQQYEEIQLQKQH